MKESELRRIMSEVVNYDPRPGDEYASLIIRDIPAMVREIRRLQRVNREQSRINQGNPKDTE